MTTLGLLLLVGALVPAGRRLGYRLGEAAARVALRIPVVGALIETIRTRAWLPSTRRKTLAVGLVLTAIAVGVFNAVAEIIPAEQLYREGQKLYEKQKFDECRPLFEEAQRRAPLAAIAVHAAYFEGISYYRQQRNAEAEVVFRRLLRDFPEAVNAPEAQYHLGLFRRLQNDVPGAIKEWEETQRRYPLSDWARYAGERLAEVRK
jgi:outer membrane protein assembly factor BamD (BamD/ComL family)